jgi:hypothetical protein
VYGIAARRLQHSSGIRSKGRGYRFQKMEFYLIFFITFMSA